MLASDRQQSSSEDGALHWADRIDSNDSFKVKLWTSSIAVGALQKEHVVVTWSAIKLDLQDLVHVVEGDDVKLSTVLCLASDKHFVVAEDRRNVREILMQLYCQVLLEHG